MLLPSLHIFIDTIKSTKKSVKAGISPTRKKSMTFLRKLSPAKQQKKYNNYILLKKPSEVFLICQLIFYTKFSVKEIILFCTCWQRLNLVKREYEDFVINVRTVNRESERFKLNELNLDMFKSLIFVHGLTADIDSWVLVKLEQDQTLTLQAVAEKTLRIMQINLKSRIALRFKRVNR